MSSRTDLLVRISELYYQQNLSQQDISKITGISRPTISRLLDEAKETGVVEIIVHSPINKNPQLSHLVRTTFGLRDAVIVAGDYEFDQSLTRWRHTVQWIFFRPYWKTTCLPAFHGVVRLKHCAMSSNRPIIPTTIM